MMTAQEAARIRLATWHDVSAWIAYAALEFVPDETTRGYLLHVSESVRSEGERRFAGRAGFAPAR